jgi:hypothetical protein
MTTRPVLLTVVFVGALSLVCGIVAQTKKSRSVTLTLHSSPQIIKVDSSNACVDVYSKSGLPKDTVEWRIDPSSTSVTDFHVIFLTKSPFQNHERYFDKHRYKSSPLNPPSVGLAEDFEYIISVDGGQTCDPHVIVIGGDNNDKN